jgi:type I restriction-modification system DNA methylase subunit
MSKHQELSSFIWNVCDDVLRGLFKQHEYGDVILPFVVLRRLDCVLEPNKDEIYNLYVVKESGQFSCREFRCLNVRFFLLKIVVFVFLVTVV